MSAPSNTKPAFSLANRPPTKEERRRTQRVMISMPVLVHIVGKPSLKGRTLNVSAGGALVELPEPLAVNAKVLIEHPASGDCSEARVVRPPQITPEGAQVPLEFSTPSPTFWHISFPSPSS